MNRIDFGDCRSILKKWKEDGVKAQMCVTSPPYFGLRDYEVDGQIGLETSPDEYIENLVTVFSAVKDILSKDGILWLNIGDSYAGSLKCKSHHRANSKEKIVYKSKDLIGIPWMLAFALRADGWFLRQDIIWNKPNATPESIKDRCTKAHEYIFLLSKSKRYFYDQKAILEDAKWDRWSDQTVIKEQPGTANWIGNRVKSELQALGKKNKRSVWTIPTKPYADAHFATFPPALIEPCILAGSRVNDVVLDPFMGSGTTAEVCILNNRQYLGCEINKNYKCMQDNRIAHASSIIV